MSALDWFAVAAQVWVVTPFLFLTQGISQESAMARDDEAGEAR